MKLRFLFYILLILISGTFAFANQEENEVNEIEVKSAFVYNFMRFVEWPNDINIANRLPSGDKESINILVIGDTLLAQYLSEFSINSESANKKIHIEYADTITSLENKQIVYLGGENCNKYENKIIELSKNMRILTISDCENFISKGGMIELFLVGPRVRFSVNKTAAERENMTISSRLLKLAIEIK